MPGDFCITWHERDYSGLKVIFYTAVLRLTFCGAVAGDWVSRAKALSTDAAGVHALGDQRAGNGIRTLLGETHVQVVTPRAVGITNHV